MLRDAQRCSGLLGADRTSSSCSALNLRTNQGLTTAPTVLYGGVSLYPINSNIHTHLPPPLPHNHKASNNPLPLPPTQCHGKTQMPVFIITGDLSDLSSRPRLGVRGWLPFPCPAQSGVVDQPRQTPPPPLSYPPYYGDQEVSLFTQRKSCSPEKLPCSPFPWAYEYILSMMCSKNIFSHISIGSKSQQHFH